jgi:hypothetical protein
VKAIYDLVGMKYRGSEKFVRAQPNGVAAKLVREPMNKHDPWAVQVWLGGEHVAYVKGTQVGALARKMDAAGKSSLPGFLVADEVWPKIQVEES